jgi:nucleotide-binding universal stress UspA family protein
MTNTLLVGIDGSEGGKRAADFAAVRAKAAGARVIVAYVIEWSQYSFSTPEENEVRHKRREEEIERAHAHVLDPVVAAMKSSGIEAESIVRHGHPAQVMCGLAKETGAVQIFIGRRGHSKLELLLFGSVAGTLVQISPVPVTVVP